MTMLVPLSNFLRTHARWSDPIFRVSLSLIFVIGGLGHFVQHRQMLNRMAESPWSDAINAIGNPSIFLWLSGIVFIIAGIALALGLLTRISSILLFVTLVPITVTMHIAPGHAGPLFKNVAILGALIHFFFRGSGAFAIDNLFSGSLSSAAKNVKNLVTNANSEVNTIAASSVIGMSSDQNVLIVDLREADELAKFGKLKGALHVPRGLLEFKADPASPAHEQKLGEGKRLILYCGSGARSALAAKTLNDMGIKNVCHVAGGFSALQKTGVEIDI